MVTGSLAPCEATPAGFQWQTALGCQLQQHVKITGQWRLRDGPAIIIRVKTTGAEAGKHKTLAKPASR